MELTSACLHWRGLLLTASLLTYWISATAQVSVEADPPSVAEGRNILLRVLNPPEKFQVSSWYKGKKIVDVNEIARFIPATSTNITGPAYSGREIVYSNGSLLIREVTLNDTGTYTLRILKENFDPVSVYATFQVHKPVTTPRIQVSNTTVKELDSVLLTCFSNSTGISILWLFNGQTLKLTNRMKLSRNNSTLSIEPVRREDSGEYQCLISNPVSSMKSDPIRLDVTSKLKKRHGLSSLGKTGLAVQSLLGLFVLLLVVIFLSITRWRRKPDKEQGTKELKEDAKQADKEAANLNETEKRPLKKAQK